MVKRRVWKLPLSARQAAAFVKAAKAGNFTSITFEAKADDGTVIKITASDKMSEAEQHKQTNEWDEVLRHGKN